MGNLPKRITEIMKFVLSLILSFLLFAFITKLPLAFSDDKEQVLDANGEPLSPGGAYYIVGPAGGGLSPSRTQNSKCPITILQSYRQYEIGKPVKFTMPDKSSDIIFTGTPVDIDFINKPKCAESAKWLVFNDNVLRLSCVGIGGPRNYPGTRILNGAFNIQKYKFGYKLVFCISGSPICYDIGRYDNYHEDGRRLILTEHEHEPFMIEFVDATTYNQGIIKSVV